jgi:TolA-binding protein
MVFGSYLVMGKQARIDVRLIEVETSVTKATESAETPLEAVAPAMHKLAQTLAKKMGVSAGSGASGEDMATWQRYEQGVALMDARKYDEAIAVFKDVLKKNPGFDAAEKQIKLALERQSRR